MARGRELSQLGSLINVEDSTKNIGVAAATPSQKVGIGTNSPTSKVDVRGDVVISGILTAASLDGAFTGSAETLTNSRNFSITGDGSASAVGFDGSSNVELDLTLDTVNSNTGAFGSAYAIPVVTVNNKGLVTAVTTVSPGAGGTWTANNLGIHTTKNVGIGTDSAKADTSLFVRGDARITGVLSVGQGTVTIDGDTNTITASTLVGSISADNVDNFPTETDYGNLSARINDAFGQPISGARTFDALDTPTESLATQDFGALT